MSDDRGLWARTAPPGPDAAPLDGAARADVAVVGAGYTGLAAALYLAGSGASVTVLEAGDVGAGGSGRNVGLVNAGLWMAPDDIEAALGPEYGPRLVTALGDGPAEVWALAERHAMRCEAVAAGTLHCAAGRAGLEALRARAAQWQARGAPVRLLDGDETARRTGTGRYHGALLDARAGTIQPLGYARGLAHAAVAAGAVLHTNSPVRDARHEDGAWRLDTPGGTVTAGRLIVATNAYGTGPWAALRGEVTHLPYFNFATAPLPADLRRTILPGGEGCWTTRKILTSFRMDAAGRLVLGSVGALAGTGTAVHRHWALRTLRLLFPQLADQPFETAWYGRIGMTDDAMPRLHRLGPGAVAACGYNGRGIAPGTVFGRLLAQWTQGEIGADDLPLPLSPVRPARARALRETGISAGAQLYHLVERP